MSSPFKKSRGSTDSSQGGRGNAGRRGGRGGFKRGGRGGGPSKGRGDTRDTRGDPWSNVNRENAVFENYYSDPIFMDEAESEEMWKFMKTDLPNSFRFTGTKS